MTATDDNTLRALDIRLEIPIQAPRDRVWQALTENPTLWWPKDFYVGEAPRGFVLEDHVGGRVYEDWGDGEGMLWATVTVLRRGWQLQWVGDLSPDFGGPARSVTTYKLREEGDATVLEFHDAPYGRLSESAQASMEGGWRFLLEESFRPFAETGTSPDRPGSVSPS